MLNLRVRFAARFTVLAVLAVIPTSVGAQATSGDWLATRAELETRLESVSRVAASTAYGDRLKARVASEGISIQRRLADGDFRIGDRIFVRVGGSLLVNDTVTVLDGRRIVLPQLGEMPLEGVLRSELESKLLEFARQTVLDATVSARPLVRMAVFGPVTNPGYHAVPMETRLDELLASAGGPTGEADPATLRVMRGESIVLDEKEVASAIVEGRAIGSLGLREGDQLVLRPRSPPWDRTMTITLVTTLVVPIVTILLIR